jgi:hypothetical protein
VARRSRPHDDPALLVDEIVRLLTGFEKQLQGNDLRAKIRHLVPAFHRLRDLGSSLAPAVDDQSGQARILDYFRAYPHQILDGDELMVISGIGEWARRIRELRVQQGWWIYSGVTFAEMMAQGELPASVSGIDFVSMKPDQYILMRESTDEDAATLWKSKNEIRRKNIGVKPKILEYLLLNVGKAVSGEDLKYLANDNKEWARRSRELRTEDGWSVMTKMSGRPDLAPGVYVLQDARQAESHDRGIPDAVRVEVLERDNYSCTKCGWRIENMKQGDPRKLLELHHIQQHKDKGPNTAANLITLCNVHHDEVHKTMAGADL